MPFEMMYRMGCIGMPGLGSTRGFIVSVPPGFYNEPGMVCNFATGNGCVNTYAIPGSNFNGQFESTVPYANGSGAVGFRWTEKKYLELQANYFGNNNAYFEPAFFEFVDASGGYPVTPVFSLIATLRNITGIHDQSYQLFTPHPTC